MTKMDIAIPVCADNKVDTILLTSLSKGIDMARQRVPTLSDEQLGVLQHERLHHEHPRVRQRMDVLWLRANGLTQLRVAAMLGISRHTVAAYENLYEAGGLEVSTGKEVFRQRIGAPGQYIAPPIVAGEKIIAASVRGIVTVIQVDDELKILARNNFREKIFATLVVAENRIYLRTTGYLYALGE
jgi:transcriptional regulator with XRE-family HTH domain